MKFINFTIVKFSIFLVFGILASHFFPIEILVLNFVIGFLLAVSILWFFARKQMFQNVYFGVATYLCFFSIGYFSFQIRLPQFRPNHYLQVLSENNSDLIQLKIIQSLKPDKFNHKYFAEINAVNDKKTNGKILLNISKDSLPKTYSSDEILLVYSSISEIPKPLNPHQFDYSKYMESLNIYGQIRISEKDILKTQKGKPTLLGRAQNFRAHIVEKLQKTKLKTDERAIIQALVLGEKKDIDKNLYDEYAAAGVVHILAVSGLHVGVLFYILSFLLNPLKRIKFGTYFHAITIVLLLWGFAMLSGLSPSVSRAVTMFSFFAIAGIFGRQTNTLNTLFLSFLMLLIINPMWLFQVGFQLSYLAVFFIVWLHPIFYKLGQSKSPIVRKIWTMILVTLSAQIGVLPLTLYYFHQFPGLFLLTNLVVLPFLTALMCGGILIVVLATLNSLPNWLAEIYNFMIELLNAFIHWIATQEDFLFRDIHFSTLKVAGSYLFIVVFALFLAKICYRRLVYFSVTLLIFIAIYIYDEIETSANQLVIFHKGKTTLIGYKNRKDLTVFSNGSIQDIAAIPPIKSYKSAINIQNYSEEKIPQTFRYREKEILILDSLGIFPKRRNMHTVLLTNSPKLNLNRFIDSLKPKQIIADGSNYATYVARWEKTCKLKKLPFRHTAKQGAFPIE